MSERTFADLSGEEFDQLIEGFIERDDDRIELSTFLEAMAAIEAQSLQQVIELSGTFDHGNVVFDSPAPLPVGRNEVTVGDTKIVLKLRPAT